MPVGSIPVPERSGRLISETLSGSDKIFAYSSGTRGSPHGRLGKTELCSEGHEEMCSWN